MFINLEDTIKNTLKLKLRMDLKFLNPTKLRYFPSKTFNLFCKTLRCCQLSLLIEHYINFLVI